MRQLWEGLQLSGFAERYANKGRKYKQTHFLENELKKANKSVSSEDNGRELLL